MGSQKNLMLLVLVLFLLSECRAFASENVGNLYTFGDSSVDPGNNDYIPTYARSNFAPYGQNFPHRVATGRFSNGLLFPDFLANYLGAATYQRPYLAPNLDITKSPTAISFASAMSGYDPRTANKTKAIQMGEQLEYFKQYKAKLQKKVGRKKADNQIAKALYYVSAGSDDFAFTHFREVKGVRWRRSPQEYDQYLLPFILDFLQGLMEQGARKIAVSGVPPLVRFPVVNVTLIPTNSTTSQIEYVNTILGDFNSLLRVALKELQSKWPGTKISYIDFEEPLLHIIQKPDDYGFTEVSKTCCGTMHNVVCVFCNPKKRVCADPSKYVFWDAARPTEKAYEIIFKSNVAAIDELIRS